MKRFRLQIAILLITGLVVGVLLLLEQPQGSINAQPTPSQGGTYTEALIGTFQRLNPLLDDSNQPDQDVDRLLFSGLVKFDSSGVPQPDLAESWGISKDGTIYNFALRKDASWHDGVPVSSDDVIFTVELMRSAESPLPEDLKAFWSEIEVSALDTQTIQFRLPEAFSPFLDYVSFGLLPRHLLDGVSAAEIVDAPFNAEPVGTGPFKFKNLIVENGQITGLVLVRNENYYGTPAFLDELIFYYYPDGNSALQAFRDGAVQGISRVSNESLPAVLAEPGLSVYTSRLPQMTLVLLNLDDPQLEFFQDEIVRKALYLGLNRQYMIDRILAGQAILANGPILPDTWAYYEGTQPVGYDLEVARNLLREAEYVIPSEGSTVREKEGVALSFTMLYPDDATHFAIAEAIQKNWADLNVEVILEAVSYKELVQERLEARDYQAALVDLNLSGSPDPDPYPFWDQAEASGGQNYSQWDSRVASEYLETARVTTDLAERARLYRNFQVVFNDELPALMLFNPVYTYAVSEQILGVRMGPLFDSSDRFQTITQWYLAAVPATQPEMVQPTP
jgi:peptide/nickel transport system substrate-binding protein